LKSGEIRDSHSPLFYPSLPTPLDRLKNLVYKSIYILNTRGFLLINNYPDKYFPDKARRMKLMNLFGALGLYFLWFGEKKNKCWDIIIGRPSVAGAGNAAFGADFYV
jgi:hypothetical protein